MRITQNLMLQSHVRQLSSAYAQMFVVQEQLSSGKRLLRPSDDPSAIRTVLDLRSTLRRLDRVRGNADLASSELATSQGVLQNASDIVSRAREIAVAGANGTMNATDRDALAIEVDGLVDQMVALANSRGMSGFLFGGSLKGSPPFEQMQTRDGTVVLYRGDEHVTSVDLGDELQLALNVPGSEIFGIGTRGKSVYSGTTGAAAGTGNDRLHSVDHLTVAHLQTILGDGLLSGSGDSTSGLRLGASSDADDTLLGPAGGHSIALFDASGTGVGGTVSLDGGPPVNWTGADTDLAVTAGDGTVVHLDLSSVTAGFNGLVGATGSGTLSLDGGLTTSAIDFSSQNQVVVDSQTGSSLFVDARGIRRAGSDLVRQPGSLDLFNSLIELRDALKNDDGLDLDDQAARINDTVQSFIQGQDQVMSTLSRLGSRQQLADTTKARTDELSLLLTANQANLEDVDFAAATVEFSQAQLVLQAGLQVSSLISQLPSLVNLL